MRISEKGAIIRDADRVHLLTAQAIVMYFEDTRLAGVGQITPNDADFRPRRADFQSYEVPSSGPPTFSFD